MLVRKVFEALPDQGVFIVIEAFIDDARRANIARFETIPLDGPSSAAIAYKSSL